MMTPAQRTVIDAQITSQQARIDEKCATLNPEQFAGVANVLAMLNLLHRTHGDMACLAAMMFMTDQARAFVLAEEVIQNARGSVAP